MSSTWLTEEEIRKFEEAKDTICAMLEPRGLAIIVPERLYIQDDGTWHARFAMSGSCIGVSGPEALLEHFYSAMYGGEMQKNISTRRKRELFVLMLTAMEREVLRLAEVKVDSKRV